MRIRTASLVLPAEIAHNVTIDFDDAGIITSMRQGDPEGRVDLEFDTLVPGFANTHSHAFHRLLRGRTNAGRGDFWQWRTQMYSVATTLDPQHFYDTALSVYGEMRAAGYTAVGEFHYLHHLPDGSRYPRHDMELALAQAARDAGIRLTLLDTLYLTGGFNQPLSEEQLRFGDASAHNWLDRWHALRSEVASNYPEVTVGAAFHSVRAVPATAMTAAISGLPAEIPLHVHLSEQTAENEACIAATGLTPTELLASAGVLSERTTLVHATHLSDGDISLIGEARAFVSLCPTTEADLGDGLGVPEALHDAGAILTIGSDQNVVVDPFTETRGAEWMARLSTRRRGVFTTERLWRIGTQDGFSALQSRTGSRFEPKIGSPFDLVHVDSRSVRTAGSDPHQLVYSASASDVLGTIVRGQYLPTAK